MKVFPLMEVNVLYLRHFLFQNQGPIKDVSINLPFGPNGDPKPLVLVGENGTGKTIVLASITDALHEFEADLYDDILPTKALGRFFFTVLSDLNRRVGSEFGLTMLRFQDGDQTFDYCEKSGKVANPSQIDGWGGGPLKLNGWADGLGKYHTPAQGNQRLKDSLGKGAFALFLANRAEMPHWVNSTVGEMRERASFKIKLDSSLGKPLAVVSSEAENKAWLLDVILDHFAYYNRLGGEVLMAINTIISQILKNPRAGVVLAPRLSAGRVQIVERGPDNLIFPLVPKLSHLSGGQSILLNMFLTILRYGDPGNSSLAGVSGIVLIDEVDAHLHVDLQREVLPNLIALFPRVQFIVTSHSPIFLLGMERKFGSDGFTILRMPDGVPLSPKEFSEYEAVIASIDVADVIKRITKKVILLVEGSSDKMIIETAWKKTRTGEMPFEVVNAFDCHFIQNECMRERIFVNTPNRVFIGLLDFDVAYECWERVRDANRSHWHEFVGAEARGLTLKNDRFKGYLSLLPIPANRTSFASRTFGRDSCLSIELLFSDAIIKDFIEEKPLPGGGKKLKFPDDKKQLFAQRSNDLPPEEFGNFAPIFGLIDFIIDDTGGDLVKAPTNSMVVAAP